jgi:hypothetical protein
MGSDRSERGFSAEGAVVEILEREGTRFAKIVLGPGTVLELPAPDGDVSLGDRVAGAYLLRALTTGPWPGVGPVQWTVIAAVAACLALAVTGAERTPGAGADASRWALALVASVTAIGAAIVTLRGAIPADPAALHAAGVATLRTGVLAAAAVAVAWLGRHAATREFGTLLYAVLGAGALKLLLEDFRVSPPSLLVVALALYGGALILGPRIARTRPADLRPAAPDLEAAHPAASKTSARV